MRLLRPPIQALFPLVALAACAHSSPAPALTSATLERPSRDAQPIATDADEAPAQVVIPPLITWSSRYPDAARELAQWMVQNPETARELGAWQEAHPEKLEVVVDWSVTNLYGPFNAFFFDRFSWDDLRQIEDANGDALEGFVTWIRRAPEAATELCTHPTGIDYARRHARVLSLAARP
jgi:hypothetical protein